MVRPRRSGFDSARATISSLPFKAVPAAGATGATNAAAPVSARAATIFCIVPVLRGGGRITLGRLSSRSASSLCVVGALSGPLGDRRGRRPLAEPRCGRRSTRSRRARHGLVLRRQRRFLIAPRLPRALQAGSQACVEGRYLARPRRSQHETRSVAPNCSIRSLDSISRRNVAVYPRRQRP